MVNIMTQEIENYRLNWLTKRVFRVRVSGGIADECFNWLDENVEEKSFTHSFDMEADVYTFMFELAADADSFREKFLGESRTVDIN